MFSNAVPAAAPLTPRNAWACWVWFHVAVSLDPNESRKTFRSAWSTEVPSKDTKATSLPFATELSAETSSAVPPALDGLGSSTVPE